MKFITCGFNKNKNELEDLKPCCTCTLINISQHPPNMARYFVKISPRPQHTGGLSIPKGKKIRVLPFLHWNDLHYWFIGGSRLYMARL